MDIMVRDPVKDRKEGHYEPHTEHHAAAKSVVVNGIGEGMNGVMRN